VGDYAINILLYYSIKTNRKELLWVVYRLIKRKVKHESQNLFEGNVVFLFGHNLVHHFSRLAESFLVFWELTHIMITLVVIHRGGYSQEGNCMHECHSELVLQQEVHETCHDVVNGSGCPEKFVTKHVKNLESRLKLR
jgi:hypothetical protein